MFDHDQYPHADDFAGAGNCPLGEVWDFTNQDCVPRPPCDDDKSMWIEHLGRCGPNDCPDRDPEVTFKHWAGDCVGNHDNWAHDIITALKGAAKRLWPAWLMLDFMRESTPEYAEYLWNFGVEPLWKDEENLLIRQRDPSMRRWFGPYTEYRLDLVYAVLSAVLVRMTKLPVLIRCHNTNACGGRAAYAVGGTGSGNPGTIHLCHEWIEEPEDRVWRITHEYMHFTLFGWIFNFPRDINFLSCTGPNTTCYREANAGLLGDNLDITAWIHDKGDGWAQLGKGWGNEWRKLPAALCNIDNYVSWLQGRFLKWGDCQFPYGAVRP